ncbi:ABC transporter permease [Streptomyces cyanogenus]|uniref:FtsX-like permease family protein n=1 Tax=Streptomyces cyanogenus TaxID=80860 RepID=A0ABX7TZL9_STRCY|nr:FtsX-like permease family protein [Streptomyces cyanogenus]QTE00621.1 FtsX-like permease family protein [Streptomyces cyanogenus]
MNVRQWSRDLGLGVRFAFTGGREGWVRMVLTAVGVGLGVALLLLTTALPNILTARDRVEDARQDFSADYTVAKADDTVLLAVTDTSWHGKDIRGRLLEPEGAKSPLPPGIGHFPAKGEMVVSPALKRLLESDGAKLLRERIPYRITGNIDDSGLIGSHELVYYAGAEGLSPHSGGTRVERLKAFGNPNPTPEKTDPVLIMMTLVVFVVLLMPVAVFIAAAVRFGGERRDRRLAALRLVGSDSRMTRRIAAGEALAGALLGLVVGTVFFLIGRQVAGSAEVMGESFFPSYLDPSPTLAALVAVAVPAAAVLVTLLAMRGVVVEPLGVVRTAKPSRRRLWWRLLLPLAGLAMLYPMVGHGRDNGAFNEYLVVGGVLLLLVGVTALLPWLVEAVVGRLGGGSVSWQLAVRRLQLSSGTAARMVNGIAVAVAGAIALQMLFAGVESQYTKETGKDPGRAQMQVSLSGSGLPAAAARTRFARTEGVRTSVTLSTGQAGGERRDPERSVGFTVGDCAALREVARLPSCHDGDVFALDTPGYDAEYMAQIRPLMRPGTRVWIDPTEGEVRGREIHWTLPATVRTAPARKDSLQSDPTGLLVTPSALPAKAASVLHDQVFLRLDDSVPDAEEYVRTTAARVDALSYPWTWSATEQSNRYTSLRTGLFIGAVCVLALIGASLLVSQLEQLRERRKLLSSLLAFGTRRRTLGLSVLWQTAVPIALGLLLASVVGLALGALLLKMADTAVSIDWASVLSMAGAGAAVVLAVTLLSMPPLIRLMRPEGLRTE